MGLQTVHLRAEAEWCGERVLRLNSSGTASQSPRAVTFYADAGTAVNAKTLDISQRIY